MADGEGTDVGEEEMRAGAGTGGRAASQCGSCIVRPEEVLANFSSGGASCGEPASVLPVPGLLPSEGTAAQAPGVFSEVGYIGLVGLASFVSAS
jgi:hypothetical protein